MSALKSLVAGIRDTVGLGLGDQETADEVGLRVVRALAVPDLLSPAQRRPSLERYAQHVLHVEPGGSFSLVALVWLPGQGTVIHDHVSWCTVGVYEGVETEVRYRLADAAGRRRPVETARAVNLPGTVSAVAPPGDVHRVFNSGATTAISLHVYGADVAVLGGSIRRTYPHVEAGRSPDRAAALTRSPAVR